MQSSLAVARFVVQRLWPLSMMVSFTVSAFTLEDGSNWWSSRIAIATWMLLGAAAALWKLIVPTTQVVLYTVPLMVVVCLVRCGTLLLASGFASPLVWSGVVGWLRTAVAVVVIGIFSVTLNELDKWLDRP